MFSVKGKVALVTGGASGIGLACVKQLLQNDIMAIAIVDVNEVNKKKVVDELLQTYDAAKVLFLNADVSDKPQFEEAFKETVKCFNNLDIVINCAGIVNEANWGKMIAVNVNGTLIGTLLALDYLAKYKSGSEAVILNVSSITGLDTFPYIPIYTATKHAVIGFSRSFGHESIYKMTNIKVLTVCPGVTETSMFDLVHNVDVTLGPMYKQLLVEQLFQLPSQKSNSVGEAVIQIIEKGNSGSVWVAEDGEPPYEIEFQQRKDMRKK